MNHGEDLPQARRSNPVYTFNHISMFDPNITILLACLVVFAAYFLKGFSGFGPAIVMVPFFTILYEPNTAITIATLFDFIAGLFLIWTVRKEIKWSFVFSVFIALALGAVLGAYLLGEIPTLLLKRCIGAVIIIFSMMIMLQGKNGSRSITPFISLLRFPIGLVSGFLGGLLGISGPPLVIYVKMHYDKVFFRTQLIAIFLLGTGWRSLLYYWNNIPMKLSLQEVGICFTILCIGLWTGNRIQVRVNEVNFNRIVAILILLPAVNLLLAR